MQMQTNFLTFRSWAIVDIGIRTHKEKKIIVEKYFFLRVSDILKNNEQIFIFMRDLILGPPERRADHF